jgi:hypothetical protein
MNIKFILQPNHTYIHIFILYWSFKIIKKCIHNLDSVYNAHIYLIYSFFFKNLLLFLFLNLLNKT